MDTHTPLKHHIQHPLPNRTMRLRSLLKMFRACIPPAIVEIHLAQINAKGPFTLVDFPADEEGDDDRCGEVVFEECFRVGGDAAWLLFV